MGKTMTILAIVAVAGLWKGGWSVWNGIRHVKPTPIVFADSKQDMPDHVTLQNIRLETGESVMLERYRTIYIPIRPKDASGHATIRFFLQTHDPKLAGAFEPNANTSESGRQSIAHLMELRSKTAITGMIAGDTEPSRHVKSRLRQLTSVDPDFRVIVEGKTPSWQEGLEELAVSFICISLLVLLGLWDSRRSKAKAQPAIPPASA